MKTKNILIPITVVATLLAALNLRGVAATPEAEARFIADAKVAFDAKDLTNLVGLVCWDRVSPATKQIATQLLSDLVQKPVARMELVPPDPTDKTQYTSDGITYQSNLDVVRQLRITFKLDATSPSAVSIPIGEKDGKLFITTAAPVK